MKKSIPAFTDIDQYIETFPAPIQAKLQEIRKLVHSAAPGAEEGISYSMPAFKINGKYLVYFAGFKHHIGFYPFPSGVAEFKDAIVQYKTSKGAIQFPLDEPLPGELIKQIVKFRVEENS